MMKLLNLGSHSSFNLRLDSSRQTLSNWDCKAQRQDKTSHPHLSPYKIQNINREICSFRIYSISWVLRVEGKKCIVTENIVRLKTTASVDFT